MSGPVATDLDRLESALAAHGLFQRGIVHFGDDDPSPPAPKDVKAASVVLVGAIGGSVWPHFSTWRERQGEDLADPLDTWSKKVIGAIAETFDAMAYFPSDRPWQPFQQWAMRAEGLQASPLGILMHPAHGLWHSYRGALAFGFDLPAIDVPASRNPCETCRDQPCKTHCPARAVTDSGFDVGCCRSFLKREGQGAACLQGGCMSRNACPIGADMRYGEAQLRFHMTALSL